MERIKRYASGGHTRVEVQWHLAVLVAGYWGLVFCAWLGYPASNHYSITREMLSALGSFDARHNPEWFWLFSIAMIYCGLVMAPVMLYVRRRFSTVSPWGAKVGAFFFLMGCMAIMLTGLFPYAHREILGWNLAQLHVNVAGLIAICFSLGVLWHAALLLKDRFTHRTLGQLGLKSYLPFVGPFLLCFAVLTAVAYRIRWDSVHAAFRAAAHASGKEAFGDMSHAFAGMSSFPLLEHLAIWSLTLFVVWFTIILPYSHEEPRE